MRIFPAIDLSGGQVVRLTQGDYAQMQVYGSDPLQVARRFKEAGATCLHVVDLDGAKDGAPRNAAALRLLAEQSGLFLQTGGGIRTAQRVHDVLELGVGRVILGTAALRDPDFLAAMVERYGSQIAVGVDARDGKVAVEGWLQVTDTDAMAFCADLRDIGAKTIIYTDIARDGKLGGTNLKAYQALAQIKGLNIIASGGISDLSDLEALNAMGIYGAIVGKAIYEGHLDLAEAIAAYGEACP